MKKLLCAIILLLSLFVPAHAESPHFSMNNDVVQAMLESALDNGLSSRKDLQAMLNNAFLNGYDYSSVSYDDVNNIYIIDVVIDGFSSAVTSLVNSESADAANEIAKAKEMAVSHYDAIRDLLGRVGMGDARCHYKLLDDGASLIDGRLLFTLLRIYEDPVADERYVEFNGAWSETDQSQEEGI